MSTSSLWTAVLRTSCRRVGAASFRRAAVTPSVLTRSLMTARHTPVVIPLRLQTISLQRLYSSAAEALDTQNASEEATPLADEAPRFSSLEGKVHPKTLKALTHSPFNYTTMSVVQSEILPLLPNLVSPREDGHEDARDLLVKARTGTGKTIAFLVPAIEARVKELERVASASSSGTAEATRNAKGSIIRQYAMDNVGTLIISPTRELASQIAVEAQKLASHHPGFETSLFVGGVDKFRQLSRFQGGRKDILVATPGRLRDFLQDRRSGVLQALKNTKMLILDEADTLLDMGFRADIEAIMDVLPSKDVRQTLLFSATVSQGIQQIANTHLAPNHLFVNCVSQDASPVHDHIPQYHTVVPNPKDQLPHIMRLIFEDQLVHGADSKVVLFLSTTKGTQLSATMLNGLAHSVLPAKNTAVFELHSKLTMNARTNAASRFRRSTSPSILVTSDVSARGVDYPGVTRVIQVGLPKSAEQYVHRVGRTGRGGSQIGRGDLVLLPWELEFVKRNFSHIPLKPLSVKDFSEECHATATKSGDPKAIAYYPDIERNVVEFLPRLDQDAVGETMMSMIGFYASLTSGLKMDVAGLVDAMQAWAQHGMGLSNPPYVSSAFIMKLGGGRPSGRGGGGSSRFGEKREWRDNDGRSARRDGGAGFIKKPWEDRGRPPRDRDSSSGKPWENRRPWSPRADEEGGSAKPWESRGERKPWTPRDRDSSSSRPAWKSRDQDGESGYSSGRSSEYAGRRTRSYESRHGSVEE